MHLGYLLLTEDAVDLFGVPVPSFYEVHAIQTALKEKSSLLFFYADKGSCFLGLEVPDYGPSCRWTTQVSEILKLRDRFFLELAKVTSESFWKLTEIEDHTHVFQRPEPKLYSF